MVALCGLVAAGVIAFSLTISDSDAHSGEAFDFPPFRLVREESTSNFFYTPLRSELEWRGRDDWTERHIRTNGTVGLATKEVRGDEVMLYGMGPAHTYHVGDDAVHVPGVWFRDIVATRPSARETRSENGTIITVWRETSVDIEEWDADAATGIPLGYRQIVDGVIVRESRVVSVVLADGTVIP
jgi:hypothetical protein